MRRLSQPPLEHSTAFNISLLFSTASHLILQGLSDAQAIAKEHEMEASLRETNLKNFIRLLQCAAKFGDELNIHANKDLWELGVTNSSRSAFCLFKLRPSFFCRYKALGSISAQRRGVTCQLLVKSVLAVLGKSGSMTNVDRMDLKIIDPEASLIGRRKRQSTSSSRQPGNGSQSQDDADYEDDPESSGIEAKLIIKLVCKHGVTKKHSLHLASSDFLRAEVNPDTTPSYLTISAKSLRDILDHFAVVAPTGRQNDAGIGVRGENQLGWMFTRNQVRIKSWEGPLQALMTEIKIDAGEFGDDNYWVEERRVDLTIPMKEFRAALTLAEQLSISLHIAFSEASQPVTLVSHWSETEDDAEGDFDIFCAIATTTCEAFRDIPFPTGSEDRKPSKDPSQADAGLSNAQARANGAPPTQNGDRSRSSSVSHQKTKRTKLDMSSGSGSQSASMVYNSAPDPLPSDGADNGGSQPASQAVRMSQAEILEMAGFGELDENDLMEDLDRAEDEDEEEELRASQIQIEREGGVEVDGAQGITSFEPDPAIVQEMIEEDEEELMATQSQRGPGHDGFEALFED